MARRFSPPRPTYDPVGRVKKTTRPLEDGGIVFAGKREVVYLTLRETARNSCAPTKNSKRLRDLRRALEHAARKANLSLRILPDADREVYEVTGEGAAIDGFLGAPFVGAYWLPIDIPKNPGWHGCGSGQKIPRRRQFAYGFREDEMRREWVGRADPEDDFPAFLPSPTVQPGVYLLTSINDAWVQLAIPGLTREQAERFVLAGEPLPETAEVKPLSQEQAQAILRQADAAPAAGWIIAEIPAPV